MDAARHTFSCAGSAEPVERESPRGPSISLVLPAYNEQDVIAQAIVEAEEGLARITTDYEILVVDDGSSDDTRAMAQREASRRQSVRLLTHDANRGYGAALRTGFQAATKDFVGFTDADCQFHLNQLDRLVILLSSCDVACGYRIARQDGLLRSFYSKVYNVFVRLLLGIRVRDCDCAFKLFRRDVLESVTIDTDGFLINAEFLAKASMQGIRIVEVGVDHRVRPRGESTVSFWHAIPVLISLLRFWWSQVQFPACTALQRKTESWGRTKTSLATLVLGVLCALVFFMNLSYPLIEPDENRYAQIALEMVQSGDYLVPQLQGEPYLDKPPLLYWATAASFRMFGANESSARLIPASAATWTVLCIFLLGHRLLGHRIALTGAIMLLLCMGFVLAGRYLIMDGLLTCFVTSALLAGFLAIRSGRVHWGWWVVAATACGLGMMTKGPVALALIVPPMIFLQLVSHRVARISWHHWLLLASIVAGITLPWFAATAASHPNFADHFLWKHHVVRFVSAFDHREPFWYYIPILLVGMFPCSLLTAPVVAFLLGRSAALRRARPEELGFVVLAAAWIVLFFSASSCKLPTYVLPAVPLLCLAAASPVSALLKGARSQLPLERLAIALPAWATGAALVIATGLAIADLSLRPSQGIEKLASCAVVFLIFSCLAYQLVVRHTSSTRGVSWICAAAASLLALVFAFQEFVPRFAKERSVHANAARIQVNDDGYVRPVAYLDWQIDGQSFYFSERMIDRFTDENLDALIQYLTIHNEIVFVANPDGAEQLRQRIGEAATFTRLPGARGRLYVVSVSTDLPVLIGSREQVRR